jgi:hypothetical protein
MSDVLFMGDVQGCPAELRDLLEVAGFARERDRLALCSDGAAFHGEWIGRWTNGREGALVVQRIPPSREKGTFRASGVYSFGTPQAENGGFREFWHLMSGCAGPQTGRPPPEGIGLRPGPEPAERLRARSALEIRLPVISTKSEGSDRRSSPDTSRLGAAGDFQA